MRILFVCHGNICRSPMAEFVMKALVARELAQNGGTGPLAEVRVESAALHRDELGNDIHRGTRSVLWREGIPFSPRAAWLLTAAKARKYDLLVGMDSWNIDDLRRLVGPEEQGKIRKLGEFSGSGEDIADPWYTGDFERTFADVLAGCRGLIEWLVVSG